MATQIQNKSEAQQIISDFLERQTSRPESLDITTLIAAVNDPKGSIKDKKDLSNSIKKVISNLNKAGFEASEDLLRLHDFVLTPRNIDEFVQEVSDRVNAMKNSKSIKGIREEIAQRSNQIGGSEMSGAELRALVDDKLRNLYSPALLLFRDEVLSKPSTQNQTAASLMESFDRYVETLSDPRPLEALKKYCAAFFDKPQEMNGFFDSIVKDGRSDRFPVFKMAKQVFGLFFAQQQRQDLSPENKELNDFQAKARKPDLQADDAAKYYLNEFSEKNPNLFSDQSPLSKLREDVNKSDSKIKNIIDLTEKCLEIFYEHKEFFPQIDPLIGYLKGLGVNIEYESTKVKVQKKPELTTIAEEEEEEVLLPAAKASGVLARRSGGKILKDFIKKHDEYDSTRGVFAAKFGEDFKDVNESSTASDLLAKIESVQKQQQGRSSYVLKALKSEAEKELGLFNGPKSVQH